MCRCRGPLTHPPLPPLEWDGCQCSNSDASPELHPPCRHAQVPEERALADPPLLRLESEASHAYLSMLLHVQTAEPPPLGAEVRCPVWKRASRRLGARTASMLQSMWQSRRKKPPMRLQGGMNSAPRGS